MANKRKDLLEAFEPPMVVVEDKVVEALAEMLRMSRPSALEIVDAIEDELGIKARWDTIGAVERLIADDDQDTSLRRHLADLLVQGELASALNGRADRDHAAHSGIDELLRQSKAYRSSSAFSEMIQFLAKFRDYSPFNNLLVHMQNPACTLFATKAHWRSQFQREIKEDARPLVILAPRTPIVLVYDIDQTEGRPLPMELENFATFDGTWDPKLLVRLVKNAKRHYSIRVAFKKLSSTLAGFATLERGKVVGKMRIVVHSGLDQASRFGVLCHEIAHILLGHLGSDQDHWWPNRWELDRHSIEVEAEAAAFIATWRLGLRGSSARYVSRHLLKGEVPEGVSADYIARVAGRLEKMATEKLAERKPGEKRKRQSGRGIG